MTTAPVAPSAAWLAAQGHGHFDLAAWGPFEWVLFGSAALITLWVLWLAVRSTVSPGEDAPDHVKRSILHDDDDPPPPPPPPAAGAPPPTDRA